MVMWHRVDYSGVSRWFVPQGGLFIALFLALIVSPESVFAKSATETFKDNFYPVYNSTDDGPTVYTAFSLIENTGVYASSSAIFLENGLTHDFSTGYSGRLSSLSFSFSYDATQYTFSTVSDYYDRFNFQTRWKDIDARIVQDDYHRELSSNYSTDIPYGQLKLGAGRYVDQEDPNASYPFQNLQLSHYWNRFSLTSRLQRRFQYTYESYTLSHNWQDVVSNQVQYLRDQWTKKISFSSRFSYDNVAYRVQLSQTEIQRQAGYLGHRISASHEFNDTTNIQFAYDKTEEVSEGFSVLFNFEKHVDF